MEKLTGKSEGFRLEWYCESSRLFAFLEPTLRIHNLELAEQERSRPQVQQASSQLTNGSFSNKKSAGYGLGPKGLAILRW